MNTPASTASAITDEQIMDRVENELGMGYGGWDSEDPSAIVAAFRKVLASTPPAPAAPSEHKLQTAVLEEWATYERRGEICSFEGHPMIHASILEELAALAASTKGAEL